MQNPWFVESIYIVNLDTRGHCKAMHRPLTVQKLSDPKPNDFKDQLYLIHPIMAFVSLSAS